MYSHIAIEGVIGAGKTTFAKFLGAHYGAKILLEEFEDNPFLANFYENKPAFSFPLELSFLVSRYHQVKQHIEQRDIFHQTIVSDFVLYKSLVFASINLKGDELELYSKLFHIMFNQIPVPDLTIYIYHTIESLQRNIRQRGRDYELNIDDQYLNDLNDKYLAYFKQLTNHRVLILNGNKFDIVNQPEMGLQLIEISKTEYPLGITYL